MTGNKFYDKILLFILFLYFFKKRIKKIKNKKELYIIKSSLENDVKIKYFLPIKEKEDYIKGKKLDKFFLNFYLITFDDMDFHDYIVKDNLVPLINAKNQQKSAQSVTKFNL